MKEIQDDSDGSRGPCRIQRGSYRQGGLVQPQINIPGGDIKCVPVQVPVKQSQRKWKCGTKTVKAKGKLCLC